MKVAVGDARPVQSLSLWDITQLEETGVQHVNPDGNGSFLSGGARALPQALVVTGTWNLLRLPCCHSLVQQRVITLALPLTLRLAEQFLDPLSQAVPSLYQSASIWRSCWEMGKRV